MLVKTDDLESFLVHETALMDTIQKQVGAPEPEPKWYETAKRKKFLVGKQIHAWLESKRELLMHAWSVMQYYKVYDIESVELPKELEQKFFQWAYTEVMKKVVVQ